METYERKFSTDLPLNDSYMTTYETWNAKENVLDIIRMEIEKKLHDNLELQTADKLKNFLDKIKSAEAIIASGYNSHIERGAIELIRIQAILASFFVPQDIAKLIDESSQISLKTFPNIDDLEPNLTENDLEIFKSLGIFGFENDRYNEQLLSIDYLPLLDPDTNIGEFTVSEVIEWAIS